MHSKLNLQITIGSKRVGLYSFVYASKVSLSLVLFLFVSFIVQPVHLAYANENANEIADAAAAAEAEEIADEVELQAADLQEQEEETEAVDDSENIDVEITDPEPELDDTDAQDDQSVYSDGEESEVEEDFTVIENADEVSDEADMVDGDDDDELSSSATTADDESDGTASSSDEVVDQDDFIATSSDEVVNEDTASSTDSGNGNETVEVDTSSTTSTSTATTTEGGGSSVDNSGGASGSDDDDNQNDSGDDSAGTSGSENSQDSDGDLLDGTSDEQGGNADSSVDGSVSVTTEDQNVEDSEASSTQPAVDTVSVVQSIVTDDNFYQFNKQSCVAVGGGSYHCSIAEGDVLDSKAVVYSEIGPSGSPEIFIKTTDGDVEQVTDNNFEDSSPHYDPVSQRIAWQRLIQGRYQIIVYDIETAEEKQLTFSRTNNMEPSVSDDGIVWQAWDNNDWEVMFYDGTYTDQMTSNEIQDLAPVMEDGYIIWTVIGGGSQYAQVYSFETEETVTINNQNGGSIVNPRFVLVYDTKFDNGDVVTQRFDPDTGFAEAIAAQPAETPLDIPEADNTGEIKALIQTKSTSKQNAVVDGGVDGGVNGTSTPTTDTLNLTDPEQEDVDEIVVTSTDGLIDVEVEVEEDDFLELTEYDLILPPTQPLEATTSVSITNASST